jgi:type IV secretory pathway TrbL component
VAPPPPANVPLKPVSSTPASTSQPSSKTGTSVVKSAPPKETARITVKPNLPPTSVRPGGNFPATKAAGGTVPIVVAAAGAAIAAKAAAKPASSSTPATTIVNAGSVTARVVTAKPVQGNAIPGKAVPGTVAPAVAETETSPQFQQEESTTLTTVLAGVLALLTWGTAGVLIASYLALI